MTGPGAGAVPPAATPALEVSGLSKTFGRQTVLRDFSTTVQPGEVRALVGQNGSGKSTLIKMLAGVYDADPGGSVLVGGVPLDLGRPRESEAAGLRFVHQDLGLIEELSVLDNLALQRSYRTRLGAIRWREERAAARELLVGLGYDLDPRSLVGELPMSARTAVAIARALSSDRSEPRLLVLDEPSANLPAAEVDRLYALVGEVRTRGIAVLFVSHHFDEVFELADTATVLRDGLSVDTVDVSSVTESDLVELMVGRAVTTHRRAAPAAASGRSVALEVRGVSGRIVRDVDLTVSRGEIVGVAGITGSGREEFAHLLFEASRTGTVAVGSGAVVRPGSVTSSVAAGIGLVPAERRRNAAFLDESIADNITVPRAGEHFVRGRYRRRRELEDVQSWLSRLDVRPPDARAKLGTLSGGNQQKVMIARWLRQDPSVLLLDEPTQGVDVAAKSEIHRQIAAAAAAGTSVLVMSTDHVELAALCDRVVVLRGGRLVVEYDADHLDADLITAATLGRTAT